VQTLFTITTLKSISIMLTVMILLLTCANTAVYAQQDEQSKSAPATTESKTAEKTDSTAKSPSQITIEIPAPAPLTQQHKEDLKHKSNIIKKGVGGFCFLVYGMTSNTIKRVK